MIVIATYQFVESWRNNSQRRPVWLYWVNRMSAVTCLLGLRV